MGDHRQDLGVDDLLVADSAGDGFGEVDATVLVELVEEGDGVGGEPEGDGEVFAFQSADLIEGFLVDVIHGGDGPEREFYPGIAGFGFGGVDALTDGAEIGPYW